jgi:ribosomal protein L9
MPDTHEESQHNQSSWIAQYSPDERKKKEKKKKQMKIDTDKRSYSWLNPNQISIKLHVWNKFQIYNSVKNRRTFYASTISTTVRPARDAVEYTTFKPEYDSVKF